MCGWHCTDACYTIEEVMENWEEMHSSAKSNQPPVTHDEIYSEILKLNDLMDRPKIED